jgi:hypothetical protein
MAMRSWLAVPLLLAAALPARAGDAFRLDKDSWKHVPGGKEVDAIHGDVVLKNDLVVAVVADAVPGRNANLSIKAVQGAVIDFALLESNNDQLSAFLPHGDRNSTEPQAASIEIVKASGPELLVRVHRPATAKEPVEATTEYVLRDGERFLRVTTRWRNAGNTPAKARLSDKMRCDQTFAQAPAGEIPLAWFYDRWFLAAYGVVREDGKILTDGKYGGMFGPNSGTWLDYPEHCREGKLAVLAPGQEVVIARRLLVARHLGELEGGTVAVSVEDEEGRPLPGAEIGWKMDGKDFFAAWAGADGKAAVRPPAGAKLLVASPGRLPKETAAGAVRMGKRSTVEFAVTEGDGRPSPCKVQFLGLETTPNPDFGPKQRADGCANLWHSPSGRFTVPVPPGKYAVIVSRGPEYDAAWRFVQVREGETARVAARLPRVVDSRGWISTDYHNHSTPSGDNTTVMEGRLVCLAAEGVEFAAATEHNRLLSYKEAIRTLGLEGLLATSDGIELTGNPLPLNHHNAFPLLVRPGLQDGGGPITGPDPLGQIRRLFDHDGGAEKLVQQNHPDIGWLFYDADGDGSPDLGFGTAPFTHAIEIWRPTILEMKPTETVTTATNPQPQVRNNRVFNWLQLLNQGFRIPGVANTDAHYCNHESGRIRNYLKSATDDPAKVREMDVVRETKKGRLVMTNGPFLEVSLEGAGPGDELRLSGRGLLRVQVQCANWLDVDRVQVLVNGRPDPRLNFTRAAHPRKFDDGVVKFRDEIPVELEADAHLIVVAIGESSTIGPVMGALGEPPVAISNPIYVDRDGGGWTPSKDTLGAPLPVKKDVGR